ncbi:MAG: hypothetical protein NTY09_02440 [bacterium]|nr:hypothetical protein [bacterium]
MENGRSDRIQELKYRLNIEFPQPMEEHKTPAGDETEFPGDIHADLSGKDLAWIISMIDAMNRHIQA